MAITVVHSYFSANRGADFRPWPFTATLGNVLIFACDKRAASIDTSPETAGWTRQASHTGGGATNGGAIFTKTSDGTETGINFGGGNWPYDIQVWELSGATLSTVLTNTATGTSATWTGGSVTPTAGIPAFIAGIMFGGDDFADLSYTPAATWTEYGDSVGFTGGNQPHTTTVAQVVSSASGSYNPTSTASASKGFRGITISISGSPSPGVWLDWDNDGFGTNSSGSSEVGYLAGEFPEGGSTVSDDITTDVMSIDVDQGGTAEVTGGTGTDTCTIVVKNTTGKYSPDNTSSTVYGKIRPGRRVWIGVNADGTLSGTGQTIYGVFAGKVREVTPIPGGAAMAPTAEILCDGILQDYVTPVSVADSLTRSQYSYRVAVLDAIAESATRRDLDVEPDTLPLSSADSTSALAVLDDLNKSSGTRHFIAADASKDTWYKYTTRNRQYKFGAAADASIDAGTAHLTAIDGWRYNNDGIENHARASVDPVNFPYAIAQVWTYDNVPFILARTNKTIWANFDDYVRNPVLTVTSSGAAVSSSLLAFGHSAQIHLFSTGATITNIKITGQQVVREQGVSLTADDLASQSPSAYGVRSGPDLSGDLLGSAASAQGLVDHIVYRKGQRPLKRPSITTHNWLPYAFSLHLYDQIAVTVASVSASAIKFEIVGRKLHCDVAASATIVDWVSTFQLSESRIQGSQTWFTLGTSTLGGPDLLGY